MLGPGNLADFHRRFSELLVNLASLRQEQPGNDEARRVLADALDFYLARGRKALAAGRVPEARDVVSNLSSVMQQVPARDQGAIGTSLKELQAAVDKQISNRK